MHESLSSSRAVVRSAFFNLLGFTVSVLYMLFLVPIVVGHVGIEQYGLWSLVLALTGYIGLVDLGVGTSFVPYIARYISLQSYDDVNKVIQHGMLYYAGLSVLMIGTGYAVAPLLFALVRIPPLYVAAAHTLFLIGLVGFSVSSFAGVFGSVLTALQRMDTYNILLAVFLVEKFVAIIVALALGYGLLGVMVADLAVTAIGLIPLLVMTKRYFPALSLRWMGYDRAIMKQLFKFGTQLQVSRIAETIQSQFDKIILSRFIGLSAVSMYDFGSRPGSRLRALPMSAVSSLIPAVSALDAVQNRVRIQAALIRSTRYLAIVAIPMFSFFICFAGDIIHVWLGDGFEQAAMTLRILSVAHGVSVVASAMALVSQGMGEPGVQMRTTLIQATLNIILSLTLITMFGFYGAVVGTTISVIVGGVLLFQWYGKRLIDKPLSLFGEVIVKPIVAVLPAIAVALASSWGVQQLLGIRTRIEMGILLGGVAVLFLALYGGMVVWTRTVTSDDRGFLEGVMPQRFKHLLKYVT